jgi:hypothetical protein
MSKRTGKNDWILCRVQDTGVVIVVESCWFECYNPESKHKEPWKILARGKEKDMRMYKKSFMGELTNVS